MNDNPTQAPPVPKKEIVPEIPPEVQNRGDVKVWAEPDDPDGGGFHDPLGRLVGAFKVSEVRIKKMRRAVVAKCAKMILDLKAQKKTDAKLAAEIDKNNADEMLKEITAKKIGQIYQAQLRSPLVYPDHYIVGEDGWPIARQLPGDEKRKILAAQYPDAPKAGPLGDLEPDFTDYLYLRDPWEAQTRYDGRETYLT